MTTAPLAEQGEGCVSVSIRIQSSLFTKSSLPDPITSPLEALQDFLETVLLFWNFLSGFSAFYPVVRSKSASYAKLEHAIFRLIFSSSLGDQTLKTSLFCPHRLMR